MKKIVEVKCLLGNTFRTTLRLSVENYDGIHIAIFGYFMTYLFFFFFLLLMHIELLALLSIAILAANCGSSGRGFSLHPAFMSLCTPSLSQICGNGILNTSNETCHTLRTCPR